VARSTDGGSSWAKQILVKNTASSSGISGLLSGQSGCTIRTDSTGKVYVFWSGFDKKTKTQGIYLATSADGGSTYSTPRRLFTTVHTGVLDPVLGRFTMDGIAGARDDLSNAPSADIANGAPTGADATNQILLSWVDGKFGLNHEPVLLSASANGGRTWTTPRKIDGTGKPGNRGYYSAPAISPNGSDVYVTYNAWLEPYKHSTVGAASDRPLTGIMTHADVTANGTIGAFTRLIKSTPGDARGSSQNDLTAEFLGDYVYSVATRTYGAGVWNDVRNAADCPAMDRWRMSLRTGASVPSPAPQQDCPATFGNSDIFGPPSPTPPPSTANPYRVDGTPRPARRPVTSQGVHRLQHLGGHNPEIGGSHRRCPPCRCPGSCAGPRSLRVPGRPGPGRPGPGRLGSHHHSPPAAATAGWGGRAGNRETERSSGYCRLSAAADRLAGLSAKPSVLVSWRTGRREP
jgi:hypothetical protein